MRKETITLEDGRLLNYYWFGEFDCTPSHEDPRDEEDSSGECKCDKGCCSG